MHLKLKTKVNKVSKENNLKIFLITNFKYVLEDLKKTIVRLFKIFYLGNSFDKFKLVVCSIFLYVCFPLLSC